MPPNLSAKPSAICQRGLTQPALSQGSATQQHSVIPANKSRQVHSGRLEGKCLNQIPGHVENYNSKSLHSLRHRNKPEANTDLRKTSRSPVAKTSVRKWSASSIVTACPFSYPNSSKKSELDIGAAHKLCASSMRCNFKDRIYSSDGKYRTVDHFLGKNEVLSIQDVFKLKHSASENYSLPHSATILVIFTHNVLN